MQPPLRSTPSLPRGQRGTHGEQREQALLFRQLTTIACDAPLGYSEAAAVRAPADPEMLEALAGTLRFGPMTRRRLRQAAGLEGEPGAQPPPHPA